MHTEMEGEITIFLKVWLSIYLSLSYSFFAAKMTPIGLPRLLLFLPVISLFLLLPLTLHSVHFCGTTAFFIAWLANFKLLLLAFNRGPLSHPTLSLSRFLFLACLPIQIQQKQTQNTQHSSHNSHSADSSHNNFTEKPSVEISENRQKPAASYAMKAVLMGLIIRIYDYSDSINPTVILIIYCLHIYSYLEIIFAIAAAMARAVLGIELEPHFNKPYLSTSLQNFWGRRWNLMVNHILRMSVYNPLRSVLAKYLGHNATYPAVMTTFAVSGLMHELIYYYLGRVKPTWEVTWFFLLHGVCVAVEIAIKKALKGRCQLPGILGTIMTVGFVMLTRFWLFLPQLLRCEVFVKALEEYATLGAFVKDVGRTLTLGTRNVLT